jgi:hypothetical protein
MDKKQGTVNGITRRQLLGGAGKLAAGAAIVSVGGGLLAPGAQAKKGSDELPWPYRKIDPAHAADVAYENWYRNYCAYAAASGIVMPLRESVGGPYKDFPLMVVKFGEGGVEGWGTLCGTLLGASVAISLVADEASKKKLINDMMNWYSMTLMPVYEPKEAKAQFKSKTVSNSPLCHISVGKWMKAEGVALASPQRKDRCARLAASVAGHTVKLLNDWHDGKYLATYSGHQTECGITSQNNCTECHGNDIPSI